MVTCLVARNCLTLRAACAGGIVVVQNPGVGCPQLPSLAPNFCHQLGQYLFVKNAGLLSDHVVHIHDGPCLGGQRR